VHRGQSPETVSQAPPIKDDDPIRAQQQLAHPTGIPVVPGYRVAVDGPVEDAPENHSQAESVRLLSIVRES
jgi:hypothetical protein